MKIIELNIITELIELNTDKDDTYKETMFMELLADTYINYMEHKNNIYIFKKNK